MMKDVRQDFMIVFWLLLIGSLLQIVKILMRVAS